MTHARWDLDKDTLIEESIIKEGARATSTGAIVVETGPCTGRSPNAKYIVFDDLTKDVDWNQNQKCTREEFDELKSKIEDHLTSSGQYKQRLLAGHDENNRLEIVVSTEFAWHAAFANNMFIQASDYQKTCWNKASCWKLLSAPSAFHEPRVMINFSTREILISGTKYAGEIKKSVFTVLNTILPKKKVLPMHCSVNTDMSGKNPAIFFGLSGTGKTTLSSDLNRELIGDDEHGWSSTGLFNFEGGCYAKVINLSENDEPQIWKASHQYGTILENVVIGTNGDPDFNDATLTENTRASYDLVNIENASKTGTCGHPNNVIFLTCDAFGVLPPVSKLTPEEATEHFMMGYTAKVAGTEAGVTEPQATFSHCFGSPFMPLHVQEYAELFRKKVERHSVDCWLVNTGWSGGGYGTGNRMPIEVSREIVNKIISGKMTEAEYKKHALTSLTIPTTVSSQVDKYLEPEKNWDSEEDYKKEAKKLMDLFLVRRQELGI